jgi:hypothetical protein
MFFAFEKDTEMAKIILKTFTPKLDIHVKDSDTIELKLKNVSEKEIII